MASAGKSSKSKKPHAESSRFLRPGTPVTDLNKSKKEHGRNKLFFPRALLPGPWYINALIFFLCIAATLMLYSRDLHLGFFWVDDQHYVVNNPWIRSWSAENIKHIFSTPYFLNYSPLHLLSYSLDYSFNGPDGYTFHLSSNLWAGIVAGFVFLTALAITGRRIIAAASAVLFIVHPVHVEAVAWISSRKDLVAAAFALPSLLAYFYYRRGGKAAKWWYILSLLLFFLALLGKLSVATFPAVFLALDLFIEKRPLRQSLMDKIPYLAAGVILAWVVAGAQPKTGVQPDPFVIASVFAQNFWLMTGFAEYVIYRVAPQPAAWAMEIFSVLILISVFILPFLLRKRRPKMALLIYWMLFAFLPTQVLSFAYPVSDRYQFFPSVAAVILISVAADTLAKWMGRRYQFLFFLPVLLLAAFWTNSTLKYLSEWKDPRSVWFAAVNKSSDPQVYYNLGWNYMDKAARLGANPRKPPLPGEEKRDLASVVWQNDQQLPALLSEWAGGKKGGPVEKTFQDRLRQLALGAMDQALQKKGKHIMPELYFDRGLLLLDQENFTEAEKAFHAAIDETARTTVNQSRQEVLVMSHNNLGVISLRQGNLEASLQWLKMAEEEQNRFGGNWIPDIARKIQMLESFITSQKKQ